MYEGLVERKNKTEIKSGNITTQKFIIQKHHKENITRRSSVLSESEHYNQIGQVLSSPKITLND